MCAANGGVMDQNEAAEALTTIRQERREVADRLTAMGPPHLIAAVAIGAATAVVAIPSVIVLVVAFLVLMYGLLVVFGTQAKVGMVPGDTPRQRTRQFVGCAAILALFTAAVTVTDLGLRWLTLPAGVVTAVVAYAVARWWRVALRRDLLAEK